MENFDFSKARYSFEQLHAEQLTFAEVAVARGGLTVRRHVPGICAFVYDGQKWARLFQQERESCEDDPRPGRPVTVVTEENVRKIEKLVLADGRIKLWQIAEELQISKNDLEKLYMSI
ncbi:Putative uncharacterized protein FLJ37770 [Eumeta japonica]|uniref:Mariner Mos1 transposase n=1 Tax=Eumeta variegata TaxID=151549 RepID=A0A4C1SFM2_EUMVA|nr:Putative uncharacterized protein FLJ37770 [Eumeta japonica]